MKLRDMSIAQEQSESTVVALAWSPPGLAKHRRAALAVLTSNMLVSIWTSNSKIIEPKSWERVLVVNYAALLDLANSKFQNTKQANLHKIRSMAWAPLYVHRKDPENPAYKSQSSAETYLLAFATDDSTLYFFIVNSPFTCRSSSWHLEYLSHCEAPRISRDQCFRSNSQLRNEINGTCDEPENLSAAESRPSLLSDLMKASSFIDEISFGAWLANAPEIAVTYRCSGVMKSMRLSLAERQVTHYVLPLSLQRPTLNQRQWDQMYHLQKLREYDQGRTFEMRVWGFTSRGPLLAICITLHPANVPVYTTQNEERATVIFNYTNDPAASSLFPWQMPPKEDITQAQKSILGTIFDQNLLENLSSSKLGHKIVYTAACASICKESAESEDSAIRYLIRSFHLDFSITCGV